ncbi:MAG: dienelactone hydrolase family protein [Pseudomonadota bacterium]|nr:dienelactone hydrolase family protein [Pseudomonadota bacterium]
MKTNPNLWPTDGSLRRKTVHLDINGNNFLGHLVAPSASEGSRPLILVVHNYQGLKGFDVDVAEYLARVGYVGLAVDMYGNDVPADKRDFPEQVADVENFQKRCFQAMVKLDHDHEGLRELFNSWIDIGLSDEWVDADISPSAIGYCFGGMVVIEAVRGGSNLAGVVSFHGLLQTGEDPSAANYGAERPALKPCENNYNTNTVILIENGAGDHLVTRENRQRFFQEMDAAGIDWNFHHHAKTPHGFALPTRLGPPGKLHEAADRRSTQNMLSLLRELYTHVEQKPTSPNAAGTKIP